MSPIVQGQLATNATNQEVDETLSTNFKKILYRTETKVKKENYRKDEHNENPERLILFILIFKKFLFLDFLRLANTRDADFFRANVYHVI